MGKYVFRIISGCRFDIGNVFCSIPTPRPFACPPYISSISIISSKPGHMDPPPTRSPKLDHYLFPNHCLPT